MHWFMQADFLRELEMFSKSGVSCTAEQIQAFMERWDTARENALAADGPRILKVAGSEAEITIEGPLVQRPMMMMFLFGRGFTTYQDITDSLLRASADPHVKSVTLKIDSPGGQVAGLFDVLAAVDAFDKPIRTRAVNAHSAAYAIAAMTSKIEATSHSSAFGSVGVATSFYFYQGEEAVDLTNTGSPDKRPDPRTESGKAVIVRELDALNDLMVDAVARGRTSAGKPIKASAVNEAFGRGASFLAAEALSRSMIDKVAQPRLRGARAEDNKDPVAIAPGADPNTGKEETTMDIKTLMATYPALCQELIEQGKTAGTTAERDRVVAHLTLGKQSGDMDTAITAIEKGEVMTLTIQAKYMATAMNRTDQSARQTETDRAATAAAGTTVVAATATTTEPDAGDRAVAALEKTGYLKPEKKTAA